VDTDGRLSLGSSPRSNVEWRSWGSVDPLYGIASASGKARHEGQPWATDEFYQGGALFWNIFRPRWERYGVVPESCIEIGCGAGRLTRQLKGFFGQVTGVDVSAQMLELARANVPEASFHLVDAPRLPIASQSVTAAFSCEVFQHFSSPQVAEDYFREIFRVLRPGGSFLIQIPLVVFPVRWRSLFCGIHRLARFRNDLNAEWRRLLIKIGFERPFMHGMRYNMDWLLPRLGSIGFTEVEAVFFGVVCDSEGANPVLKSHIFAKRPS
jgi:ubiquinone/menaquinone biosynthesis C-methylase UbiE